MQHLKGCTGLNKEEEGKEWIRSEGRVQPGTQVQRTQGGRGQAEGVAEGLSMRGCQSGGLKCLLGHG